MRFRSFVVGAGLGLLAGATATNAATIALIDWSNASAAPAGADSNGNYWNTIGNAAAQTTDVTANNIRSIANVATTWDVFADVIDRTNLPDAGFGGTGINGPAGSAPFNQSFATTDGIYSQGDGGVAIISLSGLLASTQYDFTAIGGRAADGVDGQITVTGGTGAAGTLANNGTLLNFSVVSTSGGTIQLSFVAKQTLAGKSATFNALRISEVPEPATATALLGAAGLMLRRRGR